MQEPSDYKPYAKFCISKMVQHREHFVFIDRLNSFVLEISIEKCWVIQCRGTSILVEKKTSSNLKNRFILIFWCFRPIVFCMIGATTPNTLIQDFAVSKYRHKYVHNVEIMCK